jgi:hypothetical protein
MSYVADRDWLESLKVGDKVVVKDNKNAIKPINAIITKVTKKLIYANYDEFSRQSGKINTNKSGSNYYYLSKRE